MGQRLCEGQHEALCQRRTACKQCLSILTWREVLCPADWLHLMCTCFCRRKKDHGRAEAMLIAAWALGLRIEPETDSVRVVPTTALEESSEEAEDVLPLEEDVEEAC